MIRENIYKVPGWTALYSFDKSAILDGRNYLMLAMHPYFEGYENSKYDTTINKDPGLRKRLVSTEKPKDGYVDTIDTGFRKWEGSILVMDDHEQINATASHLFSLGRTKNVYFLKTWVSEPYLYETEWGEFIEFANNFPQPVFLVGGRAKRFAEKKSGCLGYQAHRMEKSNVPVRFIEGSIFRR